MSKLIIVESPAKAKTIQKYLGDGYTVLASMGHVRDLPSSKIGVDIENDFAPQYVPMKDKADIVKQLKKEAQRSDRVYLATDPDREGEAISWHLAHLLDLGLDEPNRVTFNEITKSGVSSGMEHPRLIDIDRVNAQQARRIVDRIVGYKLSPFLWKKVRSGLSAGRVQSVAVRIIVDREEEIRAFVTEEYWTIDAHLLADGAAKTFAARLHSHNGKKLNIADEAQAKGILAQLDGKKYVVESLKKGVRKRSPAPPFITSTLQQDASRRLGFQSRRTMKAAQELYEGVEVAKIGSVGLITYMRTDSLRISDEARAQAKEYIQQKYGEKYLPSSPRIYKSRASAQDAHEAIRPTMPELAPADVKGSLTADQYKIYKLVWERFMASQMASALLDTVSCDIKAGEFTFKASGFQVKFDGYTVLYEESRDDDASGDGEEKQGGMLPVFSQGDTLALKKLEPGQHFTQPPPRYTEASLIKALEENGIGRPSTYAPTITTITSRSYVEREQKALKPTALGEVITKLMAENFQNIIDVDFTAKMEKDLDKVAEGEMEWKDTLRGFYGDFERTLKQAEKNLEGTRVKVPDEETDIICENCGRNMVIKMGRFGKFLACPGFPECKNTKKITQETQGLCPLCGKKVLAKKSAKGKSYFGCEDNPKCAFMSWDTPTGEKCPKCGSTLFRKKGRGGKTYCAKEGCGYAGGSKE